MIECLAKAGWPEGLVQLVEGGEREGMAIMTDAAVGAVTLTGGPLAGYAAQEICGRRRIALQAKFGATTRPSSGPMQTSRTPPVGSPPEPSRWPASAAPPIAA